MKLSTVARIRAFISQFAPGAALVALALGASGCGMGKKPDAENLLAFQGKNGGTLKRACGPYGFGLKALPVLQAQCATCHVPGGNGRGAFAQGSLEGAYPEAKARTNFSSPASSLLVTKGGNGHCGNCTAATAQAIAAVIAEWAPGEAGTAAYCANAPTEGDGPSTFGDGDPGSGGGGNGGNTVQIVAAGLPVFRFQVQEPILLQKCTGCHAPGGRAAGAAFAVSQLEQSYIAAKLRANLTGDVATSLLVDRASTSNHGPGCVGCGPALGAQMLTALTDWKAAEGMAGAARIELQPKTIPTNGVGTKGTMTWAIPAELVVNNPQLAGLSFQVSVEEFYPVAGNTAVVFYRFTNPRLGTATAATSILISDIEPTFDNVAQPLNTTWKAVYRVVPAGLAITISTTTGAPVLSTSPLLIQKTSMSHTFAPSFGVLQPNI